MINLKNEIEKLKNVVITDDLQSSVFAEIRIETIDKVLSILDQYNIITAPKTIKLSEVVKRLKNNENTIIRIERYKDNSFAIFCDSCWVLTSSNHIEILHHQFIHLFQQTKWLYTLWIAGTQIVDDMESDE